MPDPNTLFRDISPPPLRKNTSAEPANASESNRADEQPSLAAIEAGELDIQDHLGHFSKILVAASRPSRGEPRINFDEWQDLYKRNQNSRGHHFVVHQHDHPIAGVHYDLRLQFSENSALSFAVPYGLPGNPNSNRPNRLAIETRVHTLWNNLLEAASHTTGSLLIWDTGEYEILPYRDEPSSPADSDLSDSDEPILSASASQPARLSNAFQAGHIRLRLHGTRLPANYTVTLWRRSANDQSAPPQRPKRKRRRRRELPASTVARPSGSTTSSDSEPGSVSTAPTAADVANASDAEDQDASIRAHNAYAGATNSIGSVHQRRWFLTLDRRRSGFIHDQQPQPLEKPPHHGTRAIAEPFVVRGTDHERSVLTGRLAAEVMADAGVCDFVARKMWRPILT